MVRMPAGSGGAWSSSRASLATRSRVAGQVEGADVLVPGRRPRAAVVGIAPALVLVAVDGVRLDARADVRDHLLGVAAVARGERLLLALGAEDATPSRRCPSTRRRASSAASRSPILRSSGTANGSSTTGVSYRPCAGGRSSSRTRLRMAVALAFAIRTASPATRSASSSAQVMARGEPPGPVHEDADAEPLVLAAGHALEAPGLDRDGLLELPDDADVGVRRAKGSGRVEGTAGQIPHCGRGYRGCAVR